MSMPLKKLLWNHDIVHKYQSGQDGSIELIGSEIGPFGFTGLEFMILRAAKIGTFGTIEADFLTTWFMDTPRNLIFRVLDEQSQARPNKVVLKALFNLAIPVCPMQ